MIKRVFAVIIVLIMIAVGGFAAKIFGMSRRVRGNCRNDISRFIRRDYRRDGS